MLLCGSDIGRLVHRRSLSTSGRFRLAERPVDMPSHHASPFAIPYATTHVYGVLSPALPAPQAPRAGIRSSFVHAFGFVHFCCLPPVASQKRRDEARIVLRLGDVLIGVIAVCELSQKFYCIINFVCAIMIGMFFILLRNIWLMVFHNL